MKWTDLFPKPKTFKSVYGIILTLLLFVFFFFSSCTTRGNPERFYDRELLQEDFKQFQRIILKRAAGLYNDERDLERLLEIAEENVEQGMPELEFFRLLSPIVAELRCGHSFLSVSASYEKRMREEGLFFPLKVRFINGKLFTVTDPYGTGVIPGTEIVAINGTPSGLVMEAITRNMTTDGFDQGRPVYDAERWFAAMYHFYVGSPEKFQLHTISPDGDGTESRFVDAVHDPSLVKTGKGILHDTAELPWEFHLADNYAYAGIRTFSYRRSRIFNDALEEFFREVKAQGISVLILDLRGNYGGSPSPTVELFRYLIQQPVQFFSEDNPVYLAKWKKPVSPSPYAFDGKLHVLMDEAGFSMNSFLLSLLKYHNIGILYGTTSSGGFQCSDASMEAILKNTGLRFRFSTDVFRVAVEGMTPGVGVQPDYFVTTEISDYLTGRDPVLETVLTRESLDKTFLSESREIP